MKYTLIVIIGVSLFLQAAAPAFAERRGGPDPSTTGSRATRQLGPDPSKTGMNMDRRAKKLIKLGQYAKAEALFKKSMTRRKKVLGPYHPLVSTSLENLAKLYEQQGQKDKAEEYRILAKEVRERPPEPELPEVAAAPEPPQPTKIEVKPQQVEQAPVIPKRPVVFIATSTST